MINRQLEPLPFETGEIIMPEILEAFAFCYLASYNTETLAARVNNAFLRAWKPDQIIAIPRVGGGRPGACVAIWSSTPQQRVIVAIEGVQSFSSLGSILDATAGTNVLSGGPSPVTLGWVPGIYWDFATSLKTALQANSIVNDFVYTRGVATTFTGHSMGAAVAQMLAHMRYQASPNTRNRLIKFGPPKLGSRAFVEYFSRTRVVQATIVNERDPVVLFPPVGRAPLYRNPINLLLPVQPYWGDGNPWRLDGRGGLTRLYPSEIQWNAIAQAGAWLGDPTVPNYWPDHTLDAYRLALMNWAAVEPDWMMWRFNAMEYNNENSWQVLFRRGIALSAMSKVVLDPPPPEAGPPTASADAQETQRYVGDNTVGASASGDWGEPAEQVIAQPIPVNWGGTTSLQTALLPRRRPVRR